MYHEIQPLPDISNLESEEIKALSEIWKNRKEELERSPYFATFLEKLKREWAIETGIIERLYNWDRGVTEILIEQGIEASLIVSRGGASYEEATNVKNLIDDQYSIVDGLFAFVKKDEQPLTEHFIRSMHQQFTRHQETTEAVDGAGRFNRISLLKGEYKQFPNNPRRPDGTMFFYCPPELVRDEMERLVKWFSEAEGRVPPEILSAWLHHRFTQIHPFQDGNGRVARALATLVFLKAGLFPLVIRDLERKEYISALEQADDGNLRPLVKLFVQGQKTAILSALNLETQSREAERVDTIIGSAIQALRAKKPSISRELVEIAEKLQGIASRRLNEVAEKLNYELSGINLAFSAHFERSVFGDTNDEDGWLSIETVASEQGAAADLKLFRAWSRMSITVEKPVQIVVSFHGLRGMTELLAASTFLRKRVVDDGLPETMVLRSSNEIFQFNEIESFESTQERFKEWLENSIVVALAEWKRIVTD